MSQNGGTYAPLLTSVTLAQTYGYGTLAADQTLPLLDANGGGLIVDGTAAGFTGTNSLTVKATSAGTVLFPRVGGLSVVSTVSVAAAAGSTWNEVDLQASTLTLTGGPAVATKVSMVHVGQGTVNGPGNTVTDAYDLLVDAAPAGTATLARLWSTGFAGAAQAQAGLVLGTGLDPPTENDLVVGAGATVVSEANSGRLGYIAGASQQFFVSLNTGAYVPLMVGPAAGGFTQGSVPFAAASGQLTQDNPNFFWNAANATLQLSGATAVTTSALTLNVSKMLAAPAAGSVWEGFRVENSILTATMSGGPVTVTELVSSHFHQPTITTSGVGALTVTDAYTVRIGAPPVAAGSATLTNAWSLGVTGAVKLLSLILIQPAAVSSGTFTGFTQVAAAHTNLTAGTEVPDTNFNLSATKTWATGAIATQRDFIVQARTYAFAAASTVATAATVAITGAPAAGANATITNPLALWVMAGVARFDGNTKLRRAAGPHDRRERRRPLRRTHHRLLHPRSLHGDGRDLPANLPSIATVGDGWVVYSADSGYNAAVNNITLVRNGTDKINNVAGNYAQNVAGSVIKLTANATTVRTGRSRRRCRTFHSRTCSTPSRVLILVTLSVTVDPGTDGVSLYTMPAATIRQTAW